MKPLYRKLNYLASTTAPTYSNDGRMRGTFVRVNIGSLISNVPGFFNSIVLSWNKEYPWEIAMDSPENGADSDMIVVPHILDVQCTFTPIHDFIPSTSIFKNFIGSNAKGWFNEGLYMGQDNRSILPNERTNGVQNNNPIIVTPISKPWEQETSSPELIRTEEP